MSGGRGAALGRPVVTPEMARRRRTVLLAGVAALAVVAGGWWIVTGPPGRIASVKVSGYDRPDQAALERAIGVVARHGTMIDPPVATLRTIAARFPWVERLTASRDLPRGLDVEIVQAEPGIVLVPSRGPRMLVSTSGRVLGPAPSPAPPVPRVRVPGDAPAVGVGLRATTVRAALAFSGALTPATARRVLALHRSGSALVGRLSGGPELRIGLPEDLAQKARALEIVLGQLSSAEEHRATYIDLSVPARPAVGNLVAVTSPPPAPTSTVAPPAPPAPAGGDTTTTAPTATPGTATTDAGGGSVPAPGPTTATPPPPAAPPPPATPTTGTPALPGSVTPSGSVPPPGP
jgi:cell division septal protein FtsQ